MAARDAERGLSGVTAYHNSCNKNNISSSKTLRQMTPYGVTVQRAVGGADSDTALVQSPQRWHAISRQASSKAPVSAVLDALFHAHMDGHVKGGGEVFFSG